MQIKGVEFYFVALTCYILYWTNKTTQSDANKNVKLDSVFCLWQFVNDCKLDTKINSL